MKKILLPGNCYIGKMSVFPTNWNTPNASISSPWRIQYRFYDPSFGKKGFLKIVKGMNEMHNLKDRQRETKILKKAELELLMEGFNPRIGKYITPGKNLEIVDSTPFISALEYAASMQEVVLPTKRNYKSQLKFLKQAAVKADILYTPISLLKSRHIKILLKTLPEIKGHLSDSMFNKYRSTLHTLFNWIIDQEYEVLEINPVSTVRKKDELRKIKITLTAAERLEVDHHLRKKKQKEFRLYSRLFYHTGARSTELLKVKGRHVDLINQQVKCTIIKGGKKFELNKPIKTITIRHWKLALKNCGPDDYVFSIGLKPGPISIDSSQINRRWNRHIKAPKDKGGLGIKVDFNAYRHQNTTEMVDRYGYQVAAINNSHKSFEMVRRVYDIKRDQRERESVIEATNYF